MAEKKDDGTSVDFLYKTMLERDPRKRRVKPVKKDFMLDFGGLDDSEDDSDFDVGKHGGGEDSDIFSDDRSGDEDDDDESESGSESDGDEEEDEEKSEEEEMSISNLLTMAERKAEARQKEKPATPMSSSGPSKASAPPVPMNIRICCICLGERSGEEDEIVECDECGISVHEGCYGISESLSVASTVSSASTEPWFCDACKAGVKPRCELCPNSGGIYKETDAGRWVHLVCALYTPGVAFGEVDKLSNITLFEMPYTRWGSRECSLCEDERLCRSGVCISCDAGMCRNYFHVSCAQREGLLSEASPEEDIADPFFAHCRQHADKSIMKVKRRNWLALQSQQRNGRVQEIEDEKEQIRVQRKLTRHRKKYELAKAKRPASWVPEEKQPRMLSTCPIALKQLLRKAELHGISSSTQEHVNKGDIRKKWHLAPAFSTEFISYYFDRNERMGQMRKKLTELMKQNETLTNQEAGLRVQYDKLHEETEEMKNSQVKLREAGSKLWKIINALLDKPKPLPEVFVPKKIPRSPSKKDPPKSPTKFLHQCGICAGTNDQHLLAKCDTCRLFYHLGCLDPPLTRMPRKTKLMGWQCSECDRSVVDETQLNPNAPRRLRDHIKLPKKFASTPPEDTLKQRIGERKRKKTPKKEALDEEKEKRMHPAVKPVMPAVTERSRRQTVPPKLSPPSSPPTKRRVLTTPPTSPVKTSVSPMKPSVSLLKMGVSPLKIPISPVKRSVSPVKMTLSPVKIGVSPVKTNVSPGKGALSLLKGVPASPSKLDSSPIKHAAPSPRKSESSESFGASRVTTRGVRANIPSVLTKSTASEKTPTKASDLPDISEDVRIISASLSPQKLAPPPPAQPKISPKRGKAKNKDARTECIACSLPGNNRTLVRCDECKFCYHFHCVDPPLKKSPKVRGYSWLCHNCDPNAESEEEEDDEEEEEGEEAVREEVDTQQFIIETDTSGDMTISKVVPYKLIGSRSLSPAFQLEVLSPDKPVVQEIIDDEDEVVMISDDDD